MADRKQGAGWSSGSSAAVHKAFSRGQLTIFLLSSLKWGVVPSKAFTKEI